MTRTSIPNEHGEQVSSTSFPPPYWVRAILLLIILSGLTLRVILPGTTVWCEDQARACALAEDIANGHWQSGGLVNSGDFRNMPGFVYLLAAMWKIWPEPMGALYLTQGLGVLAVLISAWAMRRWAGANAAWWGTALLASAPWAMQYCRWIWAQDLLFPIALIVYLFLWRWVSMGKKWALTGVLLALVLLVEVHLAGAVLGLAIGILWLWCRPRISLAPLVVGVFLAVLIVLPYLTTKQMDTPKGNRLGYQHFWRVAPAGAMSVSSAGWNLEFNAGYAGFARHLGWRRWGYDAATGVSILLLGIGWIGTLWQVWKHRQEGLAYRRKPVSLFAVLMLCIAASFILMSIRTSPTYLPVWYPLPFIMMGLATGWLTNAKHRAMRICMTIGLLAVMAGHLCFFSEQLYYMHVNRGVPQGLGQSYQGMQEEIARILPQAKGQEIWMLYEGPCSIQAEAIAYSLRHADWQPAEGRLLLRYQRGPVGNDNPVIIEPLDSDASVPDKAFLVYPWNDLQQRDAIIPRVP